MPVRTDIKPSAGSEATLSLRRRLPATRAEDIDLGRLLALALIVLVLGGVVFLATWDIPPPTARVETVIPDERLPR